MRAMSTRALADGERPVGSARSKEPDDKTVVGGGSRGRKGVEVRVEGAQYQSVGFLAESFGVARVWLLSLRIKVRGSAWTRGKNRPAKTDTRREFSEPSDRILPHLGRGKSSRHSHAPLGLRVLARREHLARRLVRLVRALLDGPVEHVVVLEPLAHEQVPEELAQVRVVGLVVEPQRAAVWARGGSACCSGVGTGEQEGAGGQLR